MTPTFYIAHSTSGRTRIRWAGDASEKTTIYELATDIANLHGVDNAVPRMTTGSIIIEHHETEWTTLQPQLTDKLSLEFSSAPPALRRSGAQVLNHRIDNFDGALKNMNLDVTSLTLLLLSVLAIIQALRGQVMGSSVTFLWYAFNIVSRARGKADQMLDDSSDSAQ